MREERKHIGWLSGTRMVGLLISACATSFALLSTMALAQNEATNEEEEES